MNETDADMGAVTDSPGDDYRPWTVFAAAGLFWLLAIGLAAAGVWGVTQIVTGDVDSASAAVGVAVIAWLLGAYYWLIGRRFLQGRNVIAQAVFQSLLWVPVGYFLRDAAHPALGLTAWGLAAVMLALIFAPPTRKAVGFGENRAFGELHLGGSCGDEFQ
ncbi:hypothetical protein L0U85_12765 [Glycomyces sp. L485]|uniref:hypothetical protein n=1 Tax=Glycomyces sp. L485 TaxID=2909235 RepID=UPI001F4A9E0B|nr:hypothetical protein [Glycomyces sp. L485]MCH7231716.1 hypothetical protein [Glycomyces sp. L485]